MFIVCLAVLVVGCGSVSEVTSSSIAENSLPVTMAQESSQLVNSSADSDISPASETSFQDETSQQKDDLAIVQPTTEELEQMLADGFVVEVQGENVVLVEYVGEGTEVVVPNQITHIGDEAFFCNVDITSVTLPDGVVEIGGSAFSDCTSLREISIPSTVTSILPSGFRACTSLTTIVLPDGITNISNGLFADCTSLVNIKIPDGVVEIGEKAFHNCKSLAEIILPPTVSFIGNIAFMGCSALAKVDLGQVVEIGNGVFRECAALTDVIIPPTVKQVGTQLFDGCAALVNVVMTDEMLGVIGDGFNTGVEVVGGSLGDLLKQHATE